MAKSVMAKAVAAKGSVTESNVSDAAAADETLRRAAQGCCPSVTAAPFDEVDATSLAQAFAALADPVRLRLFSMIASADEVCSCDLMEPLGKAQPTISHHTKALADAGLILGEKRGRWVYWRAVRERLEGLRSALR